MSTTLSATLNPALASQWHISKIFRGNQDAIWNQYTGKGVKVGVFDDGIDKNHVDLKSNYNAASEMKINGVTADPSLGTGVHGTAVAGIIAAPGKWSWRCSSASVTALTARARRPRTNSVNRSIQNQRMNVSRGIMASRGIITGASS